MINEFTLEEFKRLYDTPSKSLIEKKIDLIKDGIKKLIVDNHALSPNAFPMPQKFELFISFPIYKEEQEIIVKHFEKLKFEAKFELQKNYAIIGDASNLYFVLSGWTK